MNTKLKNYPNGYRSEHSMRLRQHFKISNRGVDWYNKHDVAFEFKESFRENNKEIKFKCPRHQLKESEFFVFCVRHREFYIIDSEFILNSYKFDNEADHCVLTLNMIKDISCYEEFDYNSLKDCLNNIKWV